MSEIKLTPAGEYVGHWSIGAFGDRYCGINSDEPIVRCRDCKHFDKGLCGMYLNAGGAELIVEPNGFCAWGEREDD